MPDNVYAMVFSPHPDDAEGGAGGTIVRWVREGKSVILVTCTNGDKGTNDPEIKPEELIIIRDAEQQSAARLLGVKELICLRHPDQTLADTPEFREEITRLIRTYRPKVVVTADFQRRYRSHPDHRATGRVVMDAVSLYARNLYAFPDLYFKEGLELHMVEEVLFMGSDAPNYCSDVTDTYDVKMAARNCHESQFGEPSLERENRMKDRYRVQAEQYEFELGEAFHRIDMSQPPFSPVEKS
ncbi:PIG-L deacetylase family protein [Chloroflexota bacterium]